MKTLVLWKRKGARTWKMNGTATSVCSALRIRDLSNLALRGMGKVAIVDARTADEARAILRVFQENLDTPEKFRKDLEWRVDLDSRRILIGADAVRSVDGATVALVNWDARIAKRGRVTENESRALRKEG